MRRLLILFAVPLIGAAPPKPAPDVKPLVTTAKADCNLMGVAGNRAVPQLRKLGELPPADAFVAVWRVDEKGCPDPIRFVDR